MICVIIPGPSIAKTRKILAELPKDIKLVEIRLDLIDDWTLLNLQQLREEFPELNVIYSIRSIEHGGGSALSEEERFEVLTELTMTNPEYIEVTFGSSVELVKKLKEANPHTKIIYSYHDFSGMPNLENLLAKMKKVPADLYKISVYVNSTNEALKLLLFMKKNPKVVVSGLGIYGKVTRILSPIFGGAIVYATSDDNASIFLPGQLSASDLINRYNFDSLNPQTKIYALIGEPLDRSPSTTVYNALFKKRNIPAVYVKLPLKNDQLPEFLELIKQIPIVGLSVTAPVKDIIFPLFSEYCDDNTKGIEAINTFKFEENNIVCCNTDGIGAADAIEKFGPLENKKMLVIGAGGAVKALIREALKRGAIVIILNRTPERAEKVATELGCFWDSLENIKVYYRDGYDILVNGTKAQPITDDMILPGKVVFDFQIYPTDTKLLAAARKKDCKIVNGYEMWLNQGAEQCRVWFGEDPDTKPFMQSILKKMWNLTEF
jgi:3-dehydroquinate dehydratase/shikimate dehydrogenase